jgi:uncharacterized metal-binding protein YceD (DUF177 family)
MQIDFLKVKSAPINIDYSKNGVDIKGFIERINKNCVKLDSTFSTKVILTCSRCGKEYEKIVSYPLNLILSEGNYEDNSEIDIIEFYDGNMDFDYIAFSEVESLKEDYNYCDECKDSDEIFEVEF